MSTAIDTLGQVVPKEHLQHPARSKRIAAFFEGRGRAAQVLGRELFRNFREFEELTLPDLLDALACALRTRVLLDRGAQRRLLEGAILGALEVGGDAEAPLRAALAALDASDDVEAEALLPDPALRSAWRRVMATGDGLVERYPEAKNLSAARLELRGAILALGEAAAARAPLELPLDLSGHGGDLIELLSALIALSRAERAAPPR